jgi:hypothetical protein
MSIATRGNVTFDATTHEEDRSVQATRLLCESLGVTVPKSQMKYLTIALAETATEEVQHDPEFALRLKLRFESLLPRSIQRKGSQKREKNANPTKRSSSSKQKLVPIKQIDANRLNPYGVPDPYALLEAFGEEQLPLALKEYSLTLLNKIAADIQAKNPNTQPSNKRQKDAVVEYIVCHVVKQSC